MRRIRPFFPDFGACGPPCPQEVDDLLSRAGTPATPKKKAGTRIPKGKVPKLVIMRLVWDNFTLILL